MSLIVRQMKLEEVDLIVDYFYGSSLEFLESLGVDPTRRPPRNQWKEMYEQDYAQPITKRRSLLLLWELDGAAVGFSTADKVVYGSEAFMHLHLVRPELRQRGTGAVAVRKSVDLYFGTLRLKRLFCEPNAFNEAPNRTLQNAGFRYVKTYMTVPGLLNFHQAVTRWVIERNA